MTTDDEVKFVELWEQGLTTADIAARLGTPQGTVKSRAHTLQRQGKIQPRPRGGTPPAHHGTPATPATRHTQAHLGTPALPARHTPVHQTPPTPQPTGVHPSVPIPEDLAARVLAMLPELESLVARERDRSYRLKGGKPKPDTPPERPEHYTPACHCPKCMRYDGRRQPKKRTPPAARHLPILPEMKALLQAWLDAVRARVGADYGPDTPLWLSRKRGKGGVWRAISRQQYWQFLIDACKRVALPEFNWRNFGTHSGRKSCVSSIVEATGDITAAQHYIGHKSSAMTDKYNCADPRKQRAIGLVAARRNWAQSAAA